MAFLSPQTNAQNRIKRSAKPLIKHRGLSNRILSKTKRFESENPGKRVQRAAQTKRIAKSIFHPLFLEVEKKGEAKSRIAI